MSIIDFLLGRPLATYEDESEKIGPLEGVPIFGLDALGSAAYGPEAALTILLPLGLLGIHYIIPISALIILLLTIVYFSYRQTIESYPTGGGSYTVASRNLGTTAGLLAGAALMVDYVLVVAVGISAGIGALVSAFPLLQPYTLILCLVSLAIIGIVNLRGVRDASRAFMFPTYLFVGCLGGTILLGLWKTIDSGGQPIPMVQPPVLGSAKESVTMWLLLRAFSSGCTAMTGVEAVSNGVAAFKEPKDKMAKRTLTAIIVILIMFLAGIAYLCKAYKIGATVPGQPGYQSVLSQLIEAVEGRNWFYYLSIGSILLVLVLQANTAFADFPRLCRALAEDEFLPPAFANRGRRLVYTHGIVVLLFLSAFILFIFGGITDRLIPLFAVGAFLAFTLSQAGMVWHWKRTGGPHARHSILINGLGATATAVTLGIVIVSKFSEGAWITVLIVPGLIMLMRRIRKYYSKVEREISYVSKLNIDNQRPPMVVVPMQSWNKKSEKALRFALTISTRVIVVYVDVEERPTNLYKVWESCVEEPARKAGLPTPELVALKSPYRFVIFPILNYVLELERKNADREIAVIVPNLVDRHWYHQFLNNQTAELLTALFLLKGDKRIVIVNVPWYLKK